MPVIMVSLRLTLCKLPTPSWSQCSLVSKDFSIYRSRVSKKKSWLMLLFKELNLLNLWTIIFSTSFEYLVKKQLLGLFLKLSSRHLSISGSPGGLWLNRIHNREAFVLYATQLIRKLAHYLPVEYPIFLIFQTSA